MYNLRMKPLPNIIFKNLKPQISDAIKESCYKIDARLYNIANEVHHIPTFSIEPGVEMAKDLSIIIDKTIKEAVGLDCDVSVVTKGILLGAFRASPFMAPEAHKTIRILIEEIIQPIFKYHGDIKQAVEGIIAAIVIIAMDFKLNTREALVVAQEDILSCVKTIDPKLSDNIKKIMESSPFLQ